MGLIYKHTNTISGKAYVGLTTRTMEERWEEHLKDSNYFDYHFYKAIKLYDCECWTHEIIAEYDDEILNEAEVYWISFFDTFRNGYNSTTGGDRFIHSEEVRIKMSENHKDVSGENNPMFGKCHSEETKAKMRRQRSEETKAKLRKPKSEEHKRKISEAEMGKVVSEESIQKMSEVKMGENNPFFGKKHSPETIAKMKLYWETRRRTKQLAV